jgi:hypothetical protein
VIGKYGEHRPYNDDERKNKKYRFDKVELPFYGDVSLGNGTQYKISMFRIPPGLPHSGRLQVSIENKGAYTFNSFVHFTYAMEKLGLKCPSDARAVADFINAQLEDKYSTEDQGTYDPQYS